MTDGSNFRYLVKSSSKALSRMGLLMANLIGAGVGIDVLNISKSVSNNILIQDGVENITRGVITGRELSELFASEKFSNCSESVYCGGRANR